MIGDLFGRLLDFIGFLWPIVIVKSWQRGVYFEAGKPIRELGPGLWLYMPWFTAIMRVTVVPDIVITPRLDITLKDGTTLTFAAEADYVVNDVLAAVNTVTDYHHRVTELLAGVLSETLGEKEATELASGVRGRQLSTILARANKQTAPFGVEVKSIWFTTFVLRAKTYRLLGDGTVPWS